MEDSFVQSDICRVCRTEGSVEKPLHYPCICTGSIKYIHQECLVQWLKYSRKEYCELCHHRFSFMPIYSPDMPKRLPIRDIFCGLLASVGTAVRYWLHYTLVAFAWLIVVPLTACRIYRCLFTGSVNSVLTLPLDILSTENIASDCLFGCLIVTCTLCVFISLVYLREQILHGGGPDWLEQDIPAPNLPQEAAEANEGNNENDENNAVENDVEPPVAPNQDPLNANAGAQDDINWNPIEWDRAAEELTWERLLGFDGSLVFLEHVFWVVSLNTLFILVFTFCPYHIGHFLIVGCNLKDYVAAAQFEGFATTLCGYAVIGIFLVFLQAGSAILKFRKIKRILGICYIVVKVSLLSIIEIGVFPLISGLWLDICSLPLLKATLQERKTSFLAAPGLSLFVHWLIGMIFVFYFASFNLLLREVLRPGTLWFFKNVNDPDFNPIQEMIHKPILRYILRFLVSTVIFGTTVLLLLKLPLYIVSCILPDFLPYNIVLSLETPFSELSLELILVQVIIPALLEQGHSRTWLRNMIKGWCICVSYFLSLRSYLLGDVPINEENTNINNENAAEEDVNIRAEQDDGNFVDQGEGLGVAHLALHNAPARSENVPYIKPPFFGLRICGLFIMICITLVVCSIVCLTVPVIVGRFVLNFWISNNDAKVHELYTAACGVYICWLFIRLVLVLVAWISEGWSSSFNKVKSWSIIVSKCTVVVVLIFGLVPLLVGLLFELLVFIPLRVPLNQSPFYFLWQDWVLGILYIKIIAAVTLMGPRWWMKDAIEEAYQNGLHNMSLSSILKKLIMPILVCLGLALSIPYVVANSIIPLLVVSFTTKTQIARNIYPSLLATIVIVVLMQFQFRQFSKLYEHIRNDKYLVGRRLVNYDHKKPIQPNSADN